MGLRLIRIMEYGYETGASAKIFSFPSVDMNNAMFHHIDGKMPFHHWLVYPAAVFGFSINGDFASMFQFSKIIRKDQCLNVNSKSYCLFVCFYICPRIFG